MADAPAHVDTLHGHAGAKGNPLMHKIGGVPVLVIVGVPALLFIAFKWYQYKKNGAVPDLAGAAAARIQADGTLGTAAAGGGASAGGGGSTPATPADTNAQWARRAAAILSTDSTLGTPGEIGTALSKFLQHKALTPPKEVAIVNAALSKAGQPPEGVLDVLVAPVAATPGPKPPVAHPPVKAPPKKVPAKRPPTKAPSKAPAPKPAVRHYTVVKGDSLSAIAVKYYGAPNWQKLYNANRAAIGSNPNLIHPGLVLVIPA